MFALGFPHGYINETLAVLNMAYPCHNFTQAKTGGVYFYLTKTPCSRTDWGGCYYQNAVAMRPEYYNGLAYWKAERTGVIVHEFGHALGLPMDSKSQAKDVKRLYNEKYCATPARVPRG